LSEALGHPVAESRPRKATFFTTDPPRLITVEGGLTLRDLQRAGTFMQATDVLLQPQDPEEWARHARDFERRFERWAPIAGHPLLVDALAIVAVAERERAAETEIIFDSGRSRPGRRRRAVR
jgi:hypothetical protein